VTQGLVHELRQDGGEEHERLGVRHAHHEALAHDPQRAPRLEGGVDHVGERVPAPDGAEPEHDEVERTDELERGVDSDGPLDDGAGAERDEHDL